MKLKHILFCGAAAALCACEPLDDSNWVGNSLVDLDWKVVSCNGARPGNVTNMTIRYIPQNNENTLCEYGMSDNTGAFDVQTGCYDVIAISGEYPVSGLAHYHTASLTIPHQENSTGEYVISENPDMVYVGKAAGTYCDYLHRSELNLVMQRAFKRINFVVNVCDAKELVEDCRLELAGMAAKLNLATLSPDGTGQVVHRFSLRKDGRHLNGEGCLTTYKGFIHCLGVQGKNILDFTFTDSEYRQRTVRTDVSAFLANWNTDEVTVRFTIHAGDEDPRLTVDGFELGNTTDIEF